ncbi:MAG: cation:proton antiporter [Ruminococcaceae bacterium]|nr:cation:proton antiporter [Oscillospiraceae bacterium]
MLGENLMINYEEAVGMILFSIGFCMLLFHRNLIKKIMGLNIMDTGVFLFLTSMGYIEDRVAPIVTDPSVAATTEQYINPIPSGLVLTGIVVSVSFTGLMLGLTIRLYQRYRTLNLDEIYYKAREEHK